jgi:hypothetical protein
MPLFDQDDTMEEHQIGGSNFAFSATRIDDLGATEYTLALIAVDVSGSTASFRAELEAALVETVKSCRRSPRADNLMLRVILFDSHVVELHGFKPLTECAPDDYVGCLPRDGGMTALRDAVYSGVGSLTQYGRDLTEAEYDVNASVFIITDGADNRSTMTATAVKDAIAAAVTGEAVESITTALIGVNTGAGGLNTYLEEFKDGVGIRQYVPIADANDGSLAKLGGFISQSISSQSQALGTGGPSQALNF